METGTNQAAQAQRPVKHRSGRRIRGGVRGGLLLPAQVLVLWEVPALHLSCLWVTAGTRALG